MHRIDVSTPVVVLKMEHYGALGIVRSLGRWGVPVYGVDVDRQAPAAVSRYCQRSFVWDVDGAPDCSTVQFIISVARRLRHKPILIATSDETALLVARHADVLGEYFLFPHQPLHLVQSLCSKKTMHFLAREHDVPAPETVFPQCRDDVTEFLKRATFPVMLKGIDGGRLEKRTGKKMIIVRTAAELFQRYIEMEDPTEPNLMLQEYIPGGDDCVWMFNGYFNEHSDCLLGFTGKKIRQNPVYTGMTSLGICLPNETVAETTKRFMKAIGYQGILDIGFRYDARDGSYKVLDINPRIGATFRLFIGQKEMDVVRALYLDLTGQSTPADLPKIGRKWFVEDKDLRSSYNYYRDGKLLVREWLRSFRGVEEAGYFAPDDLKPFFRMIGRNLTRLVDKLARNGVRERAWQTDVTASREPTREDKRHQRKELSMAHVKLPVQQ